MSKRFSIFIFALLILVSLPLSAAEVQDPNQPLPEIGEAPPSDTSDRLSPTEMRLSDQRVRLIRQVLCLPPEGGLGPAGSPARSAIREFVLGSRVGTRDPEGVISPAINSKLEVAIATVFSCEQSRYGFRNAYEVGRYGISRSPAHTEFKIKELQQKLRTKLNINLSITGVFDPATRNAIVLFRARTGLAQNQQVDQVLWDALYL